MRFAGMVGFLPDAKSHLEPGKSDAVLILPGPLPFTAAALPPCFADGKIFNTDEAGNTFVIEAAPHFKLLRKNALDEMTRSSPAVADGAIYLRTVSRLYSLASGGAAAPAPPLSPANPTSR